MAITYNPYKCNKVKIVDMIAWQIRIAKIEVIMLGWKINLWS